ncbi:MAG: Do family serine endopeptidase [Pyrinomonadaceae bacterium]
MFHYASTSNSSQLRRQLVVFAFIFWGSCASQAFGQPEKISISFAAVTRKVEPAVVSIDTKTTAMQPADPNAAPSMGNDDIMEFLRKQAQQRPVRTVGSGFIVDKSGYLVTNKHVIDGAARIIVTLESGEEFAAKVIGSDEETDLAVLKIDSRRDLPFLKFGDSDKAEVGDWVLAIGSPFGLTKSVTAGIISQTRRETPYASVFQKFIQTDAAINRGNSGGPLVNMDGDVVGVNSQIATSTGDYNGVGFALPSREAETVYNQIVKNGKVRRGYLGVILDSVRSEFASVYGMKDARGAIVTDIRDKKGPAASAGIQVGDVIIEYNGQTIAGAQDLIARVSAATPEQSITLKVLRENGAGLESKTLSTKLGERPPMPNGNDRGDELSVPDVPVGEPKPLGLTLAVLTPTMAPTYRLQGQKGLVVKEINPASFISDVKNSVGGDALVEGDLIQRINRTAVSDLKAFNDIAGRLKAGDPVVLHILTYNPAAKATQLKIVQFTVK